MRKTILVTGAAGFIGSNLCKRLLENEPDVTIVGIDNMSGKYEAFLKVERLRTLNNPRFAFRQGDISDKKFVESLFSSHKFSVVVNLAAQAGVRDSIANPDVYISSNIVGFHNILEACRNHPVEHLVFASSSSVYGSNEKIPYSEDDKTDSPVSLYAATKKSNELFAHAYAKLYGIPCTGLRFFTVYGPAGRPDMAYFKFTEKLIKGEPIQIYNHGDMRRDFTYIDDVVTGIEKVLARPPSDLYKIYNIGSGRPESIMRFVEILEDCLIKEGLIKEPGKMELLPIQAGDVYQTFADVSELERDFGFRPSTPLEKGLSEFVSWRKSFYD